MANLNEKFWSIDSSSFKYASKPGTPRNGSNGVIRKKITSNGTVVEGLSNVYPYTPIQEFNYYENSDISEKIPFVPSTALEDAVIYPLGGNLRRYPLSDFLDKNKLKGLVEGSLDEINYTDSSFGTAIGSNWEGSFSVGRAPRNGNIIDNGVSVNKKLSILNVFDREEITLNNNSSQYSRDFHVTPNKDYCFSFYVKSDTSGSAKIETPEIPIKDTYNRVVLPYTSDNNGLVSVTLRFTSSGKSTVSIFGVCLSEGKIPVEVDYRTDGKNRPLVFIPGLSSLGVWTVKYTRYLSYRDESTQFTDFVGGCEISYPQKRASDYEFVTVVYNGSSYSTYVRGIDGSVNKSSGITVPQNRSISVGGVNVDILLGGHMDGSTPTPNFIPTPGIYRDLMVFNQALDENVINSIDNSLMSLTFMDNNNDTKYYIRSSLFKETL